MFCVCVLSLLLERFVWSLSGGAHRCLHLLSLQFQTAATSYGFVLTYFFVIMHNDELNKRNGKALCFVTDTAMRN